MREHTPGPWSLNPNNSTEVFFGPADSGRDTIDGADVYWCEDFERAEANARLIAAAPELLTTLSRLLDEVMVNEDVFSRLAPLTLEQAINAVARAEGRI